MSEAKFTEGGLLPKTVVAVSPATHCICLGDYSNVDKDYTLSISSNHWQMTPYEYEILYGILQMICTKPQIK